LPVETAGRDVEVFPATGVIVGGLFLRIFTDVCVSRFFRFISRSIFLSVNSELKD